MKNMYFLNNIKSIFAFVYMILLTYPILIDFNWVRDSLIDKCDVYKYLHKNKFECKYPQSSIGFTYIDEIINILFDRCIQLNYFYN